MFTGKKEVKVTSENRKIKTAKMMKKEKPMMSVTAIIQGTQAQHWSRGNTCMYILTTCIRIIHRFPRFVQGVSFGHFFRILTFAVCYRNVYHIFFSGYCFSIFWITRKIYDFRGLLSFQINTFLVNTKISSRSFYFIAKCTWFYTRERKKFLFIFLRYFSSVSGKKFRKKISIAYVRV